MPSPSQPGPYRQRSDPTVRLLSLMPSLVAGLWIVGVTRFRDLDLDLRSYVAIFATTMALLLLLRRARPMPPHIDLAAGSNPRSMALLVAVLTGGIALLLGGALEALLAGGDPPIKTPWHLRTLWHGACAFAAAYFRLLGKLRVQGEDAGSSSSRP
jgi:hypothetical protein